MIPLAVAMHEVLQTNILLTKLLNQSAGALQRNFPTVLTLKIWRVKILSVSFFWTTYLLFPAISTVVSR